MRRSGHPVGPFLTALLGGVLMMSNGIVTFLVGANYLYAGNGAAWSQVTGFGYFELAVGFVVVLLAALLLIDPSRPTTIGIAIAALSLVSYFGGGGFFVGLILGVVGGIWALFVQPSGERELGPAADVSTTRVRDQRCSKCGRTFSGAAAQCPFCNSSADSNVAS